MDFLVSDLGGSLVLFQEKGSLAAFPESCDLQDKAKALKYDDIALRPRSGRPDAILDMSIAHAREPESRGVECAQNGYSLHSAEANERPFVRDGTTCGTGRW